VQDEQTDNRVENDEDEPRDTEPVSESEESATAQTEEAEEVRAVDPVESGEEARALGESDSSETADTSTPDETPAAVAAAAEAASTDEADTEPSAAELSAESAGPTEATIGEEGSEAPEEEEVVEPPAVIQPPPDDGIKRRWYAVHAHSGQEANVQEALKVKAEQEGLDNLMTNVFVPMEDVTEYRSGEKKTAKRKFFPGYLLLQLPEHPEKYADLWHLIKDTPGVTGFIGSRTVPVPLEDAEVQALVEEIRGERERPKPKLDFEVGERVKINEGAFANFMGNIGEINEERGKLKVLIEIFERQTSVEVDFWQVEKI